jgi:hypothetical protein
MSKHYRHYKRRKAEEVKAILFTGSLAVVIGLCLTVSIASAGPFVLGTEMNSNGTVEYLCLGNGCENMTAMDW